MSSAPHPSRNEDGVQTMPDRRIQTHTTKEVTIIYINGVDMALLDRGVLNLGTDDTAMATDTKRTDRQSLEVKNHTTMIGTIVGSMGV